MLNMSSLFNLLYSNRSRIVKEKKMFCLITRGIYSSDMLLNKRTTLLYSLKLFFTHFMVLLS